MFKFIRDRKIKKYKKVLEETLEANNRQKEKYLIALENADIEELEILIGSVICRCISDSGLKRMKKLGMYEEIEKESQSVEEMWDLHSELKEKLQQEKEKIEIKKVALALKKLGY